MNSGPVSLEPVKTVYQHIFFSYIIKISHGKNMTDSDHHTHMCASPQQSTQFTSDWYNNRKGITSTSYLVSRCRVSLFILYAHNNWYSNRQELLRPRSHGGRRGCCLLCSTAPSPSRPSAPRELLRLRLHVGRPGCCCLIRSRTALFMSVGLADSCAGLVSMGRKTRAAAYSARAPPFAVAGI